MDVLVNATRPSARSTREEDIPGNDDAFNGDDVNFNTCKVGSTDTDFQNYELMVHEAGHALGLSEYDPPSSWWSNEPSHPTIPDTVMNYRVHETRNSDEPDCAPHPFDMMAIEALYQTIVP